MAANPVEAEVTEKDQEATMEMAESEAGSYVFKKGPMPQAKVQGMEVVLEEGMQEENQWLQQAWKDLEEEKAQLQLQKSEFACQKATDEYEFNEKH